MCTNSLTFHEPDWLLQPTLCSLETWYTQARMSSHDFWYITKSWLCGQCNFILQCLQWQHWFKSFLSSFSHDFLFLPPCRCSSLPALIHCHSLWEYWQITRAPNSLKILSGYNSNKIKNAFLEEKMSEEPINTAISPESRKWQEKTQSSTYRLRSTVPWTSTGQCLEVWYFCLFSFLSVAASQQVTSHLHTYALGILTHFSLP